MECLAHLAAVGLGFGESQDFQTRAAGCAVGVAGAGVAGAVLVAAPVVVGAPLLTVLLGVGVGTTFAAIGAGIARSHRLPIWITRLHVPSFIVTLAGFIGWQGALLYVLGPTGSVNLTSRIESQTLGNQILISRSTRDAVGNDLLQ